MAPPAKRRKVEPAVEEISFDLAARQEFLTGFHKRKVQRAKHAQEKAEQRARQDRIEERKKLRDERKAELERHVQTVNEMLRPAGLEVESSNDDDDEGEEEEEEEKTNESDENVKDLEPQPVDHEAEYIDEDKYTTVTVEAMDVTRDGLFKATQDGSEDEKVGVVTTKDVLPKSLPETRSKPTKRPWSKERPPDKAKKPKKKRNFKYEGKIERKVNRVKERVKNRKQAQARKAG